jgi:hypothetical protein
MIKIFTFLICTMFMISTSHAREQIKVITSFTQTADGLFLLKSFFDSINNDQTNIRYVIQSLPGANGLNAYRQFQNENNSLLFTQHTMFIENKIDYSNHLLYALYRSNHEVLVNRNSNIKTVDDLIALHKQRNIFHGRVSSSATSQISLAIFMKEFDLNSNQIVNITAYSRVEELLYSLVKKEIDFVIRSKSSAFINEDIASILTLDFGPVWLLTIKSENRHTELILEHVKKLCDTHFLDDNKVFVVNNFTKMCSENSVVTNIIQKDINNFK